MSDIPALPSPEDIHFFQQIAADMRARPGFYREAGVWLDNEFSKEAMARKGLRGGERSLIRLREAARSYTDKPTTVPTLLQAKQIILLTWLLTDTTAEQSNLGLTEFEKWGWSDLSDKGDFESRQYASEVWAYIPGGYRQWTALARKAWAVLSPDRMAVAQEAMKAQASAEVAACLKNAPGENPTSEQVTGWLFDSRKGVAVHLSRIVQDTAARDLLTEAAGRSWRECIARDSEPQRLWRDLRESFARIAAEDDRASVRVGPFPKDRSIAVNLLPTALLDGSRTVRTLAGECRDFCAAPLLTPSDLVCQFPEVSSPYYAAVREWQDNPRAVSPFCNVQQVPVGDFIPASIVFRLRLLTELRFVLRPQWTECAEINHEYKGFADRANAIHGQLWATADAEERNGAMALLQIYLAGGKPRVTGLMGYEADWSILPTNVPTLLDTDLDRPMDSDQRIEALGLPLTFSERRGRLEYSVQEAVKTRPSEVLSIVKGGLEWLAASPPPQPGATDGEFIGWLLGAPEPPELRPRELALLEAHLAQPLLPETVQREKQQTGHSQAQENRSKLKLIRDYNRNLQGQPAKDQPKGGPPPDTEEADEGTGLSPSRTMAAAVYDYAVGVIPGAAKMTRSELFDAIHLRLESEIAKPYGNETEKLQELRDSLPSNAETFGKYLRDAGIKKYNSRGDRVPGRSIRRSSEI